MWSYNQLLLSLTLVFTTIAGVRLQVMQRRMRGATWDELLAMLEPTEMGGITALALAHQNPDDEELQTEPTLSLSLVGGVEGLFRIRRNAGILLALASRAEQWDVAVSQPVAKLIRADGLCLRKAAIQIAFTDLLRYRRETSSFYIRVVAHSYYEMTEKLLELCRETSSEHLATLDAAIWEQRI